MTPDHRESYALPDQVCVYGSKEDFKNSRKESGQWVFWEDRVDLVLEGRYHEVKPLHVELSPTYLCNFACPWCSCRTAREDWVDEDVFTHPKATEFTVMSNEKLRGVLTRLADERIGVQWVGGEPTMHSSLYPMCLMANHLGLKQCLFTNGSLLNERRIDMLFEAQLVFIRISLDAATEHVHQVHHGYGSDRDYGRRVRNNLRILVKRRKELEAKTMIGVSVVVDERNLHDVLPTATFIRDLCVEHGNRAIDYVIIRPTYQFYNAEVRLGPETATRLKELIEHGSLARELLESVGVNLIAPTDCFNQPNLKAPDQGRNTCLSCGWFGEITPSGDMLVCSDRYGNPSYSVGNVAQQTISDIWLGGKRRSVISWVNKTSCYQNHCPRNGRGFYLNNIFHSIEKFREIGRIDEVKTWIDDLRLLLPRPDHSFFL